MYRRLSLMKKEEGYLTVELTIVFSTIFFVLMILLFLGMVLYQHVNLQSLAVRTSERGAFIYATGSENMESGVIQLGDFKNRDPYRYVVGWASGEKTKYEEIMNQYVAGNIGKRNVLKSTDDDAEYSVKVKDYVVSQKVRVKIHVDYNMPTDAIAKMFGLEGMFEIDTDAVSTVVDNAEFIRNTDICVDLIKQTDSGKKVMDLMSEGKQDIVDALS